MAQCRMQQCTTMEKKLYEKILVAFVYLLWNLCGILAFSIQMFICWISSVQFKRQQNIQITTMRAWVNLQIAKLSENVAQHVMAFRKRREKNREREKEKTLKRTNIKYEKWLVFEFHFFAEKERWCLHFMWEPRESHSKIAKKENYAEREKRVQKIAIKCHSLKMQCDLFIFLLCTFSHLLLFALGGIRFFFFLFFWFPRILWAKE